MTEEIEKHKNHTTARGVSSSELLDGMCSCVGLQKAINVGVESMKNEGAPGYIIDDYIQEMQTGYWVKCSCNCNE